MIMEYDIDCPYCGAGNDINHDDGHGYSEDEKHHQQCRGCHQYFVFTTTITFNYYPEKADCLNDGEHVFEPMHTFPKEFTKMECKVCDETRQCTHEEMAEIMK